MSHAHTSRKRRNTLAVAVNFALLSSTAYAADTRPPEPFPAYLDGQLVPAKFDDPAGTGTIHHDADRLDNDVKLAVESYCAMHPSLLACELKGHAAREVAGVDGKHSAYSLLDITVVETTASNHTTETVIHGGIYLVRSCPGDAVLVNDRGVYLDNRAWTSGMEPAACLAPNALPKGASLGIPQESGANQCPIGNSPTIGNPINPL